MVQVAGLRSQGLEFEPLPAVELTQGGVDSACHPSDVGEMSSSALVIEAPASTAHPRPQNDATSSHRLHTIALVLLLLFCVSQTLLAFKKFREERSCWNQTYSKLTLL